MATPTKARGNRLHYTAGATIEFKGTTEGNWILMITGRRQQIRYKEEAVKGTLKACTQSKRSLLYVCQHLEIPKHEIKP